MNMQWLRFGNIVATFVWTRMDRQHCMSMKNASRLAHFDIETKELASILNPVASSSGFKFSNHGQIMIFAGGSPAKLAARS